MKPYCMISNAKTFAFSAENPTGARAGGSKGGDCTKLSPTVTIRAGETVTLVDTDGPGMIQSIWFTGWKICGAQFRTDPGGSRTGTELLLGDAFQKALPDHHGKPRRKGSEPVLYHHRLSL